MIGYKDVEKSYLVFLYSEITSPDKYSFNYFRRMFMREKLKVELGDEVKDVVTGFKGVVFGITVFLQGCRRIGIQPPVDKDGKLADAHWFDEPQIEVIRKGKVRIEQQNELETKKKDGPGGPMVSVPTKNMPG